MISQKALEKAFPGKGKELRDVLAGKVKTKDYAFKKPIESINSYMYISEHERIEYMINDILNGYGTEAIFSSNFYVSTPILTYVNLGDTYTLTLCFDYLNEKWVLSSWGDMLEYFESRGYRFE
jgi:hypothetical protein